jgi:hypothetical protein
MFALIVKRRRGSTVIEAAPGASGEVCASPQNRPAYFSDHECAANRPTYPPRNASRRRYQPRGLTRSL